VVTNIILSSPTIVTSDAEVFYRDYWLPSGANSTAKEQLVSRRKFIIQNLLGNVTKGSNILELGVGGEGGIIAALRETANVHGVDVSDSAIIACHSMGIPVSKLNCDQQALPFNNCSFDAVIALEVFEHFANPQFVIEEIRRVLKPQGLFIASVPSVYTYHWPRLFYPDLFHQTNFRDFLLTNRFMPTLHDDPLQKNHFIAHPTLSSSEKSFSLYWQTIRLDECDLPSLHAIGKELFARKDQNGIRIRPIEALELFKQCIGLGPASLELETDYLCALLYRVINGDTNEFVERLGKLMEIFETTQNKAPYAQTLLEIHHEAEQLGKSFMDNGLLHTLTTIVVAQ
jgi:SAM-dependent methyltransferase